MNTKQLPVKAPDPRAELMELRERMNKAKEATPEDMHRLRQVIVSTPHFWPVATQTANVIREQLIEKMSSGITRSHLLAEVDILKKQFGYDAAPVLERLLIDHILTARLRLLHAENYYNNVVVNQSITFAFGEYWNGVLSSAQKRFLRAIETLAKVRRLARNTPALQINIAQRGGNRRSANDA